METVFNYGEKYKKRKERIRKILENLTEKNIRKQRFFNCVLTSTPIFNEEEFDKSE